MSSSCAVPPQEEEPPQPSLQVHGVAKKKQRPHGTPDPNAEVVALSPPALLGWNRWRVCEACGRGFRRNQSLRRCVVPSNKLRKRLGGEAAAPATARKRRVFVCPEPGCQYHAPSRALADLPSLQKHFRRKHGRHGLWACGAGSGAVAVCADCKAHLKTRGTRTSGHTCDACGCVFSREESYVEHQATCGASRPRPETSPPTPAAFCGGGVLVLGLAAPATLTSQQPCQLHAVAGRPSSDDQVLSSGMASPTAAAAAAASVAALGASLSPPMPPARPGVHNLELQLMQPGGSCAPPHPPAAIPRLDLSLGLGVARERDDAAAARMMVEQAREQLWLAMEEKAAAAEAREQARRREELAGLELASAQRMRQQAWVELSRTRAARQLVNARLLQVSCCTAAAASSAPGLPH